jgi:hypothetical protein
MSSVSAFKKRTEPAADDADILHAAAYEFFNVFKVSCSVISNTLKKRPDYVVRICSQ